MPVKNHFYSTDVGQTWIKLDDIGGDIYGVSGAVLLNDNTVYRSGVSGIHKTTGWDAPWQNFNTGLINPSVNQLININNTVYANIGLLTVVRSTDSGDTWTRVTGDAERYSRMLEFDGNLYAMNKKGSSLRLFKLSHEENGFIAIPDVSPIEKTETRKPNRIKFVTIDEINGAAPFDSDRFVLIDDIDPLSAFGSFAVSRTAYYVEYNNRLYRWKHDSTEWYDTGLIDKGEHANFVKSDDFAKVFDFGFFVNTFDFGFKFAVSKNTVYVGTQDRRLMQSFDEGDTWKHATADLPFPVDHFKEIVFVGKTVYVATDKGVVRSSNGTDWQAITDIQGAHLVVDKFSVDKSMVYGLSGQIVYQLNQTGNSGTWRQVAPEITHSISTFEVDGDTVYIGTLGQGVFRFTLDDSER